MYWFIFHFLLQGRFVSSIVRRYDVRICHDYLPFLVPESSSTLSSLQLNGSRGIVRVPSVNYVTVVFVCSRKLVRDTFHFFIEKYVSIVFFGTTCFRRRSQRRYFHLKVTFSCFNDHFVYIFIRNFIDGQWNIMVIIRSNGKIFVKFDVTNSLKIYTPYK